MKELSIEEKAKRYDEAIEKAKSKIKDDKDHVLYEDDVIEIFPELTESEDKGICRTLIAFLKQCKGVYGDSFKQFDLNIDDAIAWLEKQGEQKPVDKVEPKFKVGDVIQFKGMGHTRYTVKEVCGLSHYINTFNKRMDMSYTDANFELVEQKPAMIQWKGDNLKEVVDFTGVYKEGFEKWFHNSWEEYEKYVHEHNNIFKIFNEDGSHMEIPVGAWIIKAPDGYNTASRFGFVPKPWGEEDELRFEQIDFLIRNSYSVKDYYKTLSDWFKSLKDRVQC